jgi:hypothetical protein
LFVNSDNDIYFPMPGNERVSARLERIYSLFGAGDQVDSVISVGSHAYRTDIRRASYEFFNRHLKVDTRRVVDPDAGTNVDGSTAIERKLLRVFPEDTDLPPDHINTKIDQLFVTLAKPTAPATGKFESWRRDLLDRLRKAAFADWPATAPAVYTTALGVEPRSGKETTEDGIEVYWRWAPGKDPNGARWLISLNHDEDLAKPPNGRAPLPAKIPYCRSAREAWGVAPPALGRETSFPIRLNALWRCWAELRMAGASGT